LVQRDTQEDDISFLVNFGELLEVGDFGAARWAPGRPEVDYLNLAFELIGMSFAGLQIDQLPLRRPLADLGIVFRSLKGRALEKPHYHPNEEPGKGTHIGDGELR